MKPSMSLMKMTIKLLILMILFVVLFLISSLLYSAKYWPDVYNYINANITIKRIPTLSELNLTIIEVDYVTDMYTTTDIEYVDITTLDDFDLGEFTLDEVELRSEVKRSILIEHQKDYIELPSRGIFIDYEFLEEPMTSTELPDKNVLNENEFTVTKTSSMYVGKYESKDLRLGEENGITNTDILLTEDVPVLEGNNIEQKDLYNKQPSIKFINNQILTEVTTSKEGYLLIGDDTNTNMNDSGEDMNIFDLTTTTNEMDSAHELSMIEDLVDASKLTTRSSKDVETFTGSPVMLATKMNEQPCLGNTTCKDFTIAVYPWIVAIFIKNGTNGQFSYYCDGALLSDRVILTDSRCIHTNSTLDPDDILVFLGKGSLQIMNGNEKIQKIKEIVVHDNFTKDGSTQDTLSLLVLEEPIEFSNAIQSACIQERDTDIEEAATTAWDSNGDLLPIFFNKDKSDTCIDKTEDIFCATYGNHVPLCPSYGGVYVAKQEDKWCLQGIFYGDPANRGLCFTKNVFYTSLNKYLSWIHDVIDDNKNDV